MSIGNGKVDVEPYDWQLFGPGITIAKALRCGYQVLEEMVCGNIQGSFVTMGDEKLKNYSICTELLAVCAEIM